MYKFPQFFPQLLSFFFTLSLIFLLFLFQPQFSRCITDQGIKRFFYTRMKHYGLLFWCKKPQAATVKTCRILRREKSGNVRKVEWKSSHKAEAGIKCHQVRETERRLGPCIHLNVDYSTLMNIVLIYLSYSLIPLCQTSVCTSFSLLRFEFRSFEVCVHLLCGLISCSPLIIPIISPLHRNVLPTI